MTAFGDRQCSNNWGTELQVAVGKATYVCNLHTADNINPMLAHNFLGVGLCCVNIYQGIA